MRTRERTIARTAALVTIGLLLATVATAAVEVLVKSDGSDPNAFPKLKIYYGSVLFDVPMAKMFGLDIDNNLQKLPDSERFANDFHGTMAMDKFLAASRLEHKARGILFPFLGFNNPNPTIDPQEIVKMEFTIPLRDRFGRPLGGPGKRWVKFQNGPNAGGGGGAGTPSDISEGRGGSWEAPDSTPLKVWAGVIERFRQNPDETVDEFKARSRGALEGMLRGRGRTRKQIQKYLKLLDDSDYMDPNENWVLEVPKTNGQTELVVEFAFYLQQGTFVRVAELLNNFSVAVTNDSTIAPMDPDNQPVGEILLDTGSLDPNARGADGEGVSLLLSDVEIPATAVVAGQPDATLLHSAVEITFHTNGELEATDAATQYLDIVTAGGDLHRIPFDQAGGDSAKGIAQDLAYMANVWPHDGAYQYRAIANGPTVQINHREGKPIAFVKLNRTGESHAVEEQVLYGTCEGGHECRGDVKPEDPHDARMIDHE